MRDLLGCLYYVLIWPLRSVAGELVDVALVRAGLKYRPATGRARRRRW